MKKAIALVALSLALEAGFLLHVSLPPAAQERAASTPDASVARAAVPCVVAG
jgi:hypothetical protein